MKTGFSLCGKLHRENPVLALYWPCTGLQCVQIIQMQLYKEFVPTVVCVIPEKNNVFCKVASLYLVWLGLSFTLLAIGKVINTK